MITQNFRDVKIPALETLIPGKQWVCFDTDKKPISPITLKGVTGALVEGNTDWASYDQALSVGESHAWIKGVGREFIKRQGITGIDLDDCLDRRANITSSAEEHVKRFDSYTESSPSEQGLHIFVYGSIPGAITAEPFIDHIEAYDSKRYFTITGKHYPGTPVTIAPRQKELDSFYQAVMANRKGKTSACRSLEKKIKELENRTAGHRNNELSAVAFFAGVLITEHNLLQDRIKEAIWRACEKNGLAQEEFRQTETTLSSQIKAGKKQGLVKDLPLYHAESEPSSNGNGHVQPEAFNRTDLGNAERFASQYSNRARWCHDWNTWMVFDGRSWERDNAGKIDRLAKAAIRSIYHEAAEEPDDKLRAMIAKHAVSSESNRAVRAMLDRAKSELPVTPDAFNSHTHLLNCKNGTLNLRTRELKPHNHADMLTHCLKIAYNPLAECPQWRSFVHTIFAGDTDLIKFVQQALGMSLSGDISEQCWFLCHGGGSNGKTTLLETVRIILDAYGLAANIETFQVHKGEHIMNDVAELYGARFVTAAENTLGSRLNEAFLKKVTGNEPLRARHLHENEFQFMPECTIWLAVNHKPTVRDTTKGMWRRVHFIPFTITIEENQIDKRLGKKLLEESEGILAWLVQGCMSWYQQGRLQAPKAVQEATQAYQAEMDVIKRFFEECCDTSSPNHEVGATALYLGYKNWCDANGERWEKQMSFGARMAEQGYAKRRSGRSGNYMYLGITLNTLNTTE